MIRRDVRSALTIVAVLALGTGRLGAVDFLRGDVNSDGEVSISDAWALRLWMGRVMSGENRNKTLTELMPSPFCEEAWDANGVEDSGYVGKIHQDLDFILSYLFSGGPPPPAPFPEVGPDDPNVGRNRGCEEYGGGSALEDPEASLVVLSAESSGGDDGQATVILGASHSTAIAGHSFSLILPDEIFADVQGVGGDLTGSEGTDLSDFDNGRMQGETLTRGFLNGDIPTSVEVVPIYELVVCLREGTPAGEYPLVLSAGEFVDAETGRAIKPALVSGTLTVASDVQVTGDCSPELPPPDPDPANDAKNVTWRIDDAIAAPGDSIVLPFIMRSDGNVEGYSFSVDFDEELLTATEIEEAWEVPEGVPIFFSVYEFNNDNNTPGNGGVDEGFLAGAAVFSFGHDVSLPANEDVAVLRFHLDIDAGAQDTTTEVRFMDGGTWNGKPRPNVVTVNGASVGLELLESFVLVDCTLQIQAIIDITTFRRGDSNGDGAVNVSDAQHTLNYLFGGSSPPWCYDAADSNDDGQLNIADPINTLRFLFVESGPATLPPPYPDEGEDPTADGMTCSVIAGR